MATQTMIISPTYGNFVFDAVFSAEHSGSVSTTKHPVQYGASVTDHAINEPDEVMLSIGMSDAATAAGTNHSVNAFQLLRQIKEKREPVTLVTRLATYANMLITSMSVPDDYTTMNALKASLIFTHIDIAVVTVVTVQQTVSSSKTTSSGKSSSSKKKSSKKSTKKKSTKTAKQTNTSTLSRIASKLTSSNKTPTKTSKKMSGPTL